jgi:TRAP-type C4-dicarboxylate transport system substrate-binding protein
MDKAIAEEMLSEMRKFYLRNKGKKCVMPVNTIIRTCGLDKIGHTARSLVVEIAYARREWHRQQRKTNTQSDVEKIREGYYNFIINNEGMAQKADWIQVPKEHWEEKEWTSFRKK